MTPQDRVFWLALALGICWSWIAVSTLWGARRTLPVRVRPHHLMASITQAAICFTLVYISGSGYMTAPAADIWPATLGFEIVTLATIVLETRRQRHDDPR